MRVLLKKYKLSAINIFACGPNIRQLHLTVDEEMAPPLQAAAILLPLLSKSFLLHRIYRVHKLSCLLLFVSKNLCNYSTSQSLLVVFLRKRFMFPFCKVDNNYGFVFRCGRIVYLFNKGDPFLIQQNILLIDIVFFFIFFCTAEGQ